MLLLFDVTPLFVLIAIGVAIMTLQCLISSFEPLLHGKNFNK